MDNKNNNLKEKLNMAGLKATPQRLIILEELLKSTLHPSANMINVTLKEKGYNYPVSTVYNTLDALCGNGLAIKLKDEKDVMRFDGNTDFHIHLYSKGNEEILDYFDSELEVVLKEKLRDVTKENKIKAMQLLIQI